MKFIEPFGRWLKDRRKALDLTQKDLAEEIGCAEITVRKMEANAYRPSKQIAARLADILVIAAEDRAAFMSFVRGASDHVAPIDLTTLTATNNLPPQLTPFIGRASELATISANLANPNCRLLSLVGPGGIGKTRLALRAVTEQLDQFAHGVYFVSLTPVNTQGLIAAAIASALQMSFYGSTAANAQVINYLRGKQMLLILDNFEHLLEGTALLTDILNHAPKVKLVVTTREKLNMQEEWAFLVDGLTIPEGDDHSESNEADAVKLFVQSALRTQPAFTLPPNAEAVIDICRAVEGMPLGIELAASWLRAMTCQQIAQYIRHDLDFLASPLRNIPERHRSLRTVFDHSWQMLSTVERDVLSSLTVFRGGFDLEAGAHVVFASLLTLANLVDKSMIRLRPSGRYEIHELLRQYASNKLAESGGTAAVRQRHLQYFVTMAEKVEGNLFGPQHLAVCNRFEDEHNNIRAALEWSLESQQSVLGMRLAVVVGWFWVMRGYWTEGVVWLDTLIDANDLPVTLRVKALRHLLQMISDGGNNHERVPFLITLILSLIPELTDTRLMAWVYSTIGSTLSSTIDVVKYPSMMQGEAHLEKGLSLFRQLDDDWGICWSLNSLSQKLFQRGAYPESTELQDEAIRLARKVGDTSVLCMLLQLKGCKLWFQSGGQVVDQQTVDLYYESMQLYQELGYKYGLASVLSQLGKVEHLKHNLEQARNFYEKSLLLAEQVGNMWYVVNGLIALAELFCLSHEPERGARILGSVTPTVVKIFVGTGASLDEAIVQYERAKAAAQTELGEMYQTIFEDGMSLTLDWAIASALDRTPHNHLAIQ